MQAILYNRPNSLNLKEIPIFQPGPEEILLRVSCCGICGTDLHIVAGKAPSANQIILGHEFSGIIEQCGSNVKQFNEGDRVVVDPNNYCGICPACKKGNTHFCQELLPLGIYRNGAWAEYCIVPVKQVYEIPKSLPLDLAALTEPVSCIVHGWDRTGNINSDADVLIIGAGLIGLLWSFFLHDKDLQNILISEPKKSRKRIAEQLGFQTCFPQDLSIKHHKFDLIIDCSGNPQAIENTFNFLKFKGKFLLFGMCPEKSIIHLNPFKIFQKELTILGSVINPLTFSSAIEFLNSSRIEPEKLGVQFFRLADYQNALNTMQTGKSTKSLFKISGEI